MGCLVRVDLPCRLLLDTNPPAVLIGALLTTSQLARLHRDNYPPLAEAEPYPQLRQLLTHPEPAVRARVCNLLGNMCRHSAYFYSALDEHGLLPPLIQRCNDSDRSTRKFACVAIGNAGQHLLMQQVCSLLWHLSCFVALTANKSKFKMVAPLQCILLQAVDAC